MLRVTSGYAKNKRLKSPNIPHFRGVQEVVKLAIFAILGEKVRNAICLDLYAGSGNLGIEALSRGASHCDFVEENKVAENTINQNLENFNLTEKTEVFGMDAVKYVANTHKKYDVIFVDPFYENTTHKFLLKNLEEILNPTGKVFFTHGKDLNIESQVENTEFKVNTQRKYGQSLLSILSLG